MLCSIATVLVVPSQASLFVVSAASLVSITHILTNLSFRSICCATVTQSFVMVGIIQSSKITCVHLGHRVASTASAVIFTHSKIFVLALSLNKIFLYILFYSSIVQITSSSSRKKYSFHL